MNRLLPILLLCSTLAAQSDTTQQKVRDIIQKSIDALGGQAFLTYTSRAEQGRTYGFYHGASRGTGVPFTSLSRYPDKDRIDFVPKRNIYPIGPIPVWVKDNLDVILIHNGDKGYEVTAQGVTNEDPKDTQRFLRRRNHSLDAVFRSWINEPGIAYFYDGKAIVDGKTADQISLMNAKNDSVTLFIDDTSHLPLKKSYTWRDATDRERNTEIEIWDNYKNVNGIMTPHSVTRYYNGDMSHQRFLTSVTYNQEAPDSFFDATAAVSAGARAPRKK